MENENDYLDKLYSTKFEKFEVQSSDDDWNKLNSKLGKSNFLKFSFASFNVFYLAAFLSFAGTASYFGVNNAIQSKKIDSLEKKIDVLKKKVENQEENLVLTDSAKIKKIENETIILLQNKQIQPTSFDKKVNILTNKPEITLKKDSVFQKIDSSVINKPQIQKINKVKKTVFVKKDTVFVKDTIRIKKKVK
jgi:hypothetical protein